MLTIPRTSALFMALILLLFSPITLSQVYSWVDENGKQHFGDSIPPEYQDQASEYAIPDTNSAVAVQSGQRPESRDANPYSVIRGEDLEPARPPPPPNQSNRREYPDSGNCAERMAAYEESQRCFRECRVGGNNNIANCGHCPQMSRPNCR